MPLVQPGTRPELAEIERSHPRRTRPHHAPLPGAVEQRADRRGLGEDAHRGAQPDFGAGRLARTRDPARRGARTARRSNSTRTCRTQSAPAYRKEKIEATRKTPLPENRLGDERVVLQLNDAMTCDSEVPDALMDRLRERLDARGLVEVAATVAAYNKVSRLLVALKVEH